MSKKTSSWGLEVGANAIKALHLVREGGDVRVADYAILPFKKILTTPDLNVDEAIQVGLDQFLSQHDVAQSTVVLSVPGHMAFARFAKLPPVEPKKIPDIVKFEAVQQIPFPIDQVEWDYQVFAQEDAPDVEVGIFAITKERVGTFLANYRAVGIVPDGLTLSPLAVYNALAYDLGFAGDGAAEGAAAGSGGLMLMDIGTTSTDVIILEGGGIWLRTVPIGGNNFTDALVRAFKLSFPKAEKLKREAGTSKYARQIFQAMRPVFADLVQEIQRSIGFYQTLNREARLTKLIGLGSTFRLPGLQKFLKQQLQLDVVRPEGFQRIKVEGTQAADFTENAMNLATAYGCALQGLGLEKVTANILPAHIMKARMWRSKRWWFATAAGLVIAAAVAAGGKLSMDQRAYQRAKQDHAQMVDMVTRKANGYVDAWHNIENGADPRQQIENLRKVLDYRDIWPKLTEDLSRAILALNADAAAPPNYAAMEKVPREQRKRLYIDAFMATYVAPAIPADQLIASPALAGSAVVMPVVAPAPRGGAAAAPVAAGPDQPYQFLVTLVGTTPYYDGPKWINDNFIRWLQTHNAQPDRPYTIVVTDSSLPRMKQLGDEAPKIVVPGETDGRDVGPAPPPRFMPGRGGRPPRGGMLAPPSNQPTINPADAAAFAAGALPLPPFRQESREKDWKFEIRFVVQILPPEAARKAQDAAHAAPTTAPATQPVADAKEARP